MIFEFTRRPFSNCLICVVDYSIDRPRLDVPSFKKDTMYHTYVELYILEPWWQKLAIGDELFISYGGASNIGKYLSAWPI